MKSNWDCVAEYMKDKKRDISFGKYASYWFYKTPRRMLHSLSYYKFAAKMIGNNKSVLDVGCNEGLGTLTLSKECGFAKGIDFDIDAISVAKKNFEGEKLHFSEEDILKMKSREKWDAIVNFDVIEHILPENNNEFFLSLVRNLDSKGLVVIGTPSLISQEYASEVSKKGHVNIYSPERLENEMKKHFSFVFMFSAHDEVIHTGYLPLAHYLIAIGCKKK